MTESVGWVDSVLGIVPEHSLHEILQKGISSSQIEDILCYLELQIVLHRVSRVTDSSSVRTSSGHSENLIECSTSRCSIVDGGIEVVRVTVNDVGAI